MEMKRKLIKIITPVQGKFWPTAYSKFISLVLSIDKMVLSVFTMTKRNKNFSAPFSPYLFPLSKSSPDVVNRFLETVTLSNMTYNKFNFIIS